MQILGQILIGSNYLVLWISRFAKKKKLLIFLDNISKILTIFGFLCLKNYNGIENAVFSFIRNFSADKVIKQSTKIKTIVLAAFIATIIFVYMLDYNGISTICILITGCLNAYGVIMLDSQGIRITSIIGSIFYLCFNIFSGIIIGAILEAIYVIITLLSFLIYRNKTTKG